MQYFVHVNPCLHEDRRKREMSLLPVQLCEYENQTLEAFVAASRLSAKFDCPVDRQNISLLATAHDCDTGLFTCT